MKPLREPHVVAGLLSAFVSSVVYAITLAPSVGGGDSGELMSVACAGGVAHPPGYPLFTLFARALSAIPVGAVAMRLQLSSMIPAAFATGFLAAASVRLGAKSLPSVAAACLFGFLPTVWTHATQAEVFALNNFLVAVLFYLAVERRLLAFAFIAGTALCNHHTAIFAIVPFGSFLLWHDRNKKRWALSALLFCAALLPYAYLFTAGARDTAVTWGQTTNWNGFLDHFLRRQYGTLRLGATSSGGGLWQGLVHFLQHYLHPVYGSFAVLAGVGLYFARQNRAILTVAGALLSYVLIFHSLANLAFEPAAMQFIVERFWMLPDLLLTPLAAWGAHHVFERVRKLNTKLQFAAVTVGILATVASGWRKHFEPGNTLIRNFGRAMLADLPRNSILIAEGDMDMGSLHFAQECEKFRTDVVVLDRSLMRQSWYGPRMERIHGRLAFPGDSYGQGDHEYLLQDFFDANQSRSIFLTNPGEQGPGGQPSWANDSAMLPLGLVYQRQPSRLDSELNLADYAARVERIEGILEQTIDQRELRRFIHGPWEQLVWNERLEASLRDGLELIRRSHANRDVTKAGLRFVERSLNLRLRTRAGTPIAPPVFRILAEASQRVGDPEKFQLYDSVAERAGAGQ